ncbi:MAG: neutral/alkaline non-lysosomal ceramidase N-terminal domain-containing protein [Planctomycetales bacterium]|nr:neutral/alkaline non-lysosomal ceramidase N-terminal domain-containing protein [Planctomycetales bacterium]
MPHAHMSARAMKHRDRFSLAAWCGALVAGGLILIAASSPTVASEPLDSAPTWHGGFARIEITPEFPLGMAGYGGRSEQASESLTPLFAKAMVLEDASGQRLVLVTLDLVGIHREQAQQLRTLIACTQSTDPERVVLACSHTHTGPVVGQNLGAMHYWRMDEAGQAAVDRYAARINELIPTVVEQAEERLAPITLSWGLGDCPLAVNRRNNSEPNVPMSRAAGELRGPVDHRVPVLAARDSDGELIGIVFGYACHATVLSSTQWSGDYPGFAQAALEERFPAAVAMFWAGCGADQNPLPRRTNELARHYGERLAGSVESVLRTHELRVLAPQTTASRETLPLAIDAETDLEFWRGQLGADDSFQRGRARYILESLDEDGAIPTAYPYEVVGWVLGQEASVDADADGDSRQVAWVFLGGEVVVDYSLALRQWESPPAGSANRATGFDSVWVTAYANDVMAYIPSRRVLAEGGYEGGGAMLYYGLPGLWTESIEGDIQESVARMLESDLTHRPPLPRLDD